MKAKKQILIADDDHAILEAITLILNEAGYDVQTTLDGGTVIEMSEDFPDLLLLDIWMSGVDGREVCLAWKKQDKTKNIPIIIVSANKDTEQIAKDVGADDFISKPFDMDMLLEKVARFIGTNS